MEMIASGAENPRRISSTLSVIDLHRVTNSEHQSQYRNVRPIPKTAMQRKGERRLKKNPASYRQFLLVSLVVSSCACFVFSVYNKFWQQDSKASTTIVNEQTSNETEETGCEYVSIVGDDICDDQANTKACAYDFGDCCKLENMLFSSCQDCFCFKKYTFVDKYCNTSQTELSYADIIAFHEMGDGFCHLTYNNENYDFDLGDCCLENVECVAPPTSETIGISFETVHCPPDPLCIQSNAYCIQDEVGDGICQDYNNVPLCDYDAGDCCLLEKGTECCGNQSGGCACKTMFGDPMDM